MTGEFELWWDAYPHKVGKRDAMTAFSNALLRGATLEALLSGVREYRSAKPPDRQWCNPATWLNQDRYLDQPAPVAATNGKPNALVQAGLRLRQQIIDKEQQSNVKRISDFTGVGTEAGAGCVVESAAGNGTSGR
jgi:hypothetical protein